MVNKLLRAIIKEYGWVNWGLGLVGNLLFIFGSFLFLYHQQPAAITLFIIGSAGKFLGMLGQLLIWLEENDHLTLKLE